MKLDPSVYSTLVRDRRISNGAFRLWHLLRDYASSAGICWPGTRTLTEELHCDYRSLSRWTGQLKLAGYIAIHNGNAVRSNRYHLSGVLQAGVTVKSQAPLTGKSQAGCLENSSQKLPHDPNPKEVNPRGKAPRGVLSDRQIISMEKELEKWNKELPDLTPGSPRHLWVRNRIRELETVRYSRAVDA